MRPNWDTPEMIVLQNRQEVLAANEIVSARRKQWEPNYKREYWEAPDSSVQSLGLGLRSSRLLLSLMEQVEEEYKTGVKTLDVDSPEFIISMLNQYRTARAAMETSLEGIGEL